MCAWLAASVLALATNPVSAFAVFSPGGAAVGSQGRQPLDVYQGLTPLATNGRPSGAKNAPQKPPPPKAPARADPPAVEPPVVGRPVDYSGAVARPSP